MEHREAGCVVVGLSDSLAAYEALRYAAARARATGVGLLAVRAYHCGSWAIAGEWGEAIRADAAARAKQIFDEALGGLPRDIEVEIHLADGAPATVLLGAANCPGDLLVIGASSHRLGGGIAKRCSRSAECVLVIVPTPELARSGSAKRKHRDVGSEAERFLSVQ